MLPDLAIQYPSVALLPTQLRWAKYTKEFADPDCHIVVLANKIDLADKREVGRPAARQEA